MKNTERHIRQIIREILRAEIGEAAKEDPPADDAGGEEASADDAAAGDAPAPDAGGEQGEEAAEGPNPEDLTIKFNSSRVRRYNKDSFEGSVGMVKRVTKNGLIVTTQPENVDIIVNFEDIVESKKLQGVIGECASADVMMISLKKFFKDRR